MTPAEQIAKDIWERIGLSWKHDVRLGEETLTDLLSLDFVRFASKRRFKLLQTTKAAESTRGTDLEIRMNVGGGRALLVSLQAKKLARTGRYDSLNTKVRSSNLPQIDVLDNYSRNVRAVPLYLLYNNVDKWTALFGWHCCQAQQLNQLGCTLVPSWLVRRAIRRRGCRNFRWIHGSSCTLPWRCLFDCPKVGPHRQIDQLRHSFIQPSHVWSQREEAGRYDWLEDVGPVEGAWPEWLWSGDIGILSLAEIERLWGDLVLDFDRTTDIERLSGYDFIPRRLLLVGQEEGDRSDIAQNDAYPSVPDRS